MVAVSSDEYIAAGRDGNVLGIDFVSSSKSLQLLRISVEETWVDIAYYVVETRKAYGIETSN